MILLVRSFVHSCYSAKMSTKYLLSRTYERNAVWRLGNVLWNAQQKYRERQQNGDSERNLLAGVWRQIEHKERKTIDENSRRRTSTRRNDDNDDDDNEDEDNEDEEKLSTKPQTRTQESNEVHWKKGAARWKQQNCRHNYEETKKWNISNNKQPEDKENHKQGQEHTRN